VHVFEREAKGGGSGDRERGGRKGERGGRERKRKRDRAKEFMIATENRERLREIKRQREKIREMCLYK